MKLIAGLGNPGEKYKKNRHNVGFMFVDYIVSSPPFQGGAPADSAGGVVSNDWRYNKSLRTEIIEMSPHLILSKPQTYMNLSGEAVQKIVQFWKLTLEHVIVVHDDLDIPIGKFKIEKGHGPHSHGGLRSIEGTIGADFWRIRIGVENRTSENRIPGEAYVLQNFTGEEQQTMNALFPVILEKLQL